MNTNKDDTKWLLRPTQDSDEELEHVIKQDSNKTVAAENESHIPGVRIARSDLTIPCTEIPSPSVLRESGYVDVKFTHILKHIIVQTYPTTKRPNNDSSTTTSRNNTTGNSNSTKSLSFKRRPSDLPRTNSSRLSSGLSSRAAVAALVVSNTSNQSNDGSHDHSSSRDSATVSNRDSTTGSAYLSLSPMEHHPLTIPEDNEDYHLRNQHLAKTYFPLALCSCILCCPLIGIFALLKACQVYRYIEHRELHRAKMASQRVRHWSFVAIAMGIGLWIGLAVAIVLILYNYSVI